MDFTASVAFRKNYDIIAMIIMANSSKLNVGYNNCLFIVQYEFYKGVSRPVYKSKCVYPLQCHHNTKC